MYHLPGWLSDRDVGRARARERFLDDDPSETYRPFVELCWIGKNLQVEAGYRIRRENNVRQVGSQDSGTDRVKFEDRRYGEMPDFLDALGRAFEDDVLLPETMRLRGDSAAFHMLPARSECDDLRALVDLPQQYLRKPIMRALEDVLNHGFSRFTGGVELRFEYEGRRKD
jgi:hypothetical protein